MKATQVAFFICLTVSKIFDINFYMEETKNEIVESVQPKIENKIVIQRKSNFELLRIIAMIMITFSNIASYGDYASTLMESGLWFNKILHSLMTVGGYVGVNLYVLISAYFLCKTEKFNLKKLLNISSITALYSIGFFVVFSIVNSGNFTLQNFLGAVLPIIYQTYWFVTVYFVMLLVSPLLNIIIRNINAKQHLIICGVMLSMYVLINALTGHSFDMSRVDWFIALYFCGSFIRIYADKIKINYVLFILLTILNFIVMTVGAFLQTDGMEINSILIVLSSLFIFLMFSKFTFTSKTVNFIARHTFGMYLFQDYFLFRSVLYVSIFNFPHFATTPYFILMIFACLVFVFVCALVIGSIRKLFVWIGRNIALSIKTR